MGDASCLASPESRMGREERGAGGWGRKILTCALVGASALPSVQGFATPCGALARGQLGLSAQPAWHLAAPRASGLAGRELSRGLPGRLHRQGARGFQSPVAAFECNGAGGSSKAMSVVEEYGGKLIRIDNVDSWNKLLAAHEEAGAVLVAEFRAAMCRKCMAMEVKYKRLPAKYQGKPVFFAEVDSAGVGKEVRQAHGVKKVPYFTFWADGEMVDSHLAGLDLSKSIQHVSETVDGLIESRDSSLFGDVQAVTAEQMDREEEAKKEAGAQDAMLAWRNRQAQATVVRAPGVSSTQATDTLKRSTPPPVPQQPSPVAESDGGSSADELRAQIKSAQAKPAEDAAAVLRAELEAAQAKAQSGGDEPKPKSVKEQIAEIQERARRNL